MLNSGSSSYYSSGNVYPTGRGRSGSVPPPSSLQSRLNNMSTPTSAAYGPSNTNNRSVSSSSPYTAVQTKAMFPKSRRPSPTSATDTLVFDGGFENRLSVSAPQFVPDSYTTPVPGPRSNVSTPVSIKPKLTPYKGGNNRGRNINRRSANRSNNTSSGNGRTPQPPSNNNNIQTPQNLRDNPERLAKVKKNVSLL